MPEQEDLGMEALDEVTGGNASEFIKELKNKIKNLPTDKKVALIGAIVTAIGGGSYIIKKLNNKPSEKNKKGAFYLPNDEKEIEDLYDTH